MVLILKNRLNQKEFRNIQDENKLTMEKILLMENQTGFDLSSYKAKLNNLN